MLSHPRYVIAVPDLARSAAFYRDVLGFEIEPLGDPGWRVYTRDACVILAGECPDALPPAKMGDHSYFAYVQVEPIDSFYAEVTGRGAELVKPLRDEPWGMREFGIRTADGHRMMFGARAPNSEHDDEVETGGRAAADALRTAYEGARAPRRGELSSGQ